MNEKFWANYDRLTDRTVPLPDLTAVLKLAGDFSGDVLRAMQRELARGDFVALGRLVHVLFLCPSRKYTLFLCRLLDNHRHEGYMEAIADALIDAPDERAVPSIERALDYELVGDGSSHFNRKLIEALKKIGTEDAVKALRHAARSTERLVRDDAEDALRALGGL